MVWLTWRHHRWKVLVTVAGLLALGGFLLVHGQRTADIAAGLALGSDELEQAMTDRFTAVSRILGWLPGVAILIGLFWGAPLVAREYERHTNQLAWTQSVTRLRWLATKLGTLSVLVVLAGLALGGMVSAWRSTFAGTHYATAFGNGVLFSVSAVVPAAWWVFAFMLGVAAGAVVQRMLPAMAVTVVAYWLAFWSVLEFAREHYATPERLVVSETSPVPDGALVTGWTPDARVWYYHPPSRFWQFQWTEVALLLAVTLVLTAVTMRRVLRGRV
jgi:hypothetical protein